MPAPWTALENALRELTSLAAPTGQEDEVRRWLQEEWKDHGELERSPVGNLLLHIPGPGPRLVMVAHMDELSLIVRSITADGFLRVLPGERDQFALPHFPGIPLRILAEKSAVPGMLVTTTGHALLPEQRERTRWTWDDVFVDTGLSQNQLRELGIRIGTRMVWDVPLRRMGRLLVGKALDDRLGLAVLVELCRRLEPRTLQYDLTLAATVQEEIGMLGSASLGRGGRQFDLGLIIDHGLAGDIPTVVDDHLPVRLGGGPALVHRDSSAHYSARLIRELRIAAMQTGAQTQDQVLYHYACDGANLIRQGIETALIAPPIRYSHSPFEVVDPADLEATVRMLLAFLTTPPAERR